MLDISMFDPEMIVWIDETGSDRRNSVRAYGYGLRGLTPVKHQLKVWGKRISAIGVMTTDGIEDVFVQEGPVKLMEMCLNASLGPPSCLFSCHTMVTTSTR